MNSQVQLRSFDGNDGILWELEPNEQSAPARLLGSLTGVESSIAVHEYLSLVRLLFTPLGGYCSLSLCVDLVLIPGLFVLLPVFTCHEGEQVFLTMHSNCDTQIDAVLSVSFFERGQYSTDFPPPVLQSYK